MAAPRDGFLTRRLAEPGAVLTSEGVSPSVLTSLRSRRALLAPRTRVPAGVPSRGIFLLVVRRAAPGFADDPDQDGDGDDRDDYED
jgi:hypothetical protein